MDDNVNDISTSEEQISKHDDGAPALNTKDSLDITGAPPSTSEEKIINSHEVAKEREVQTTNVPGPKVDKGVLAAFLYILRKYELKESEEALRKEANIVEDTLEITPETGVYKVLYSYKKDVNPVSYKEAYANLLKFVDNSLDAYKYELGIVLYPVFIHMYLELLYTEHKAEAVDFMNQFKSLQDPCRQEDIEKFISITNGDQLAADKVLEEFVDTQYNVSMLRETYAVLMRYLKEKGGIILTDIIESHMSIHVYENTLSEPNGFAIDVMKNENNCEVYYGLLNEPDLQPYLSPEEDEDDDTSVDGDKIKRKKLKKDPSLFSKKVTNDPNAPSIDRMPLPELNDIIRVERIKAIKESSKRVTLGPDSLPSICCYTVFNSNYTITCTEVCEDGSMLAVGFFDSRILIWSLTPQKLKSMKPSDQLDNIDLDTDDVFTKVMDERSGECCKTLLGHDGPVYRISFSPDRLSLLSCSTDGVVRLWCILTWTCLTIYKGHMYPVWDVEFSPHGYYFVSGSHDKTARLWSIDNGEPLRLFVGHSADVHLVRFHPNSNYVATASSDQTIRLWDCVTGMQVRLMTSHKGHIMAMCFSIDGKYLVSSDTVGFIQIHDLANGDLLGLWKTCSIAVTLAFSRDGNILASGTETDHAIQLWDFQQILKLPYYVENDDTVRVDDANDVHQNAEENRIEEMEQEENKNEENDEEIEIGEEEDDHILLQTVHTKQSPLMNLFFTRRNVLFAICRFQPSCK